MAEPPAASAFVSAEGAAFRAGRAEPALRDLAEEAPVALVYDASTYAVMMATPADLEDFAIGFSLTEGIVADPTEIRELEVVKSELGFEVRAWLTADRSAEQAARRRQMAGPTGCGLCGVDSLAAAVRAPRSVADAALQVRAPEVADALAALQDAQPLSRRTRAVHAAGFWVPGRGLVAVREDVGRHNALDKLAGALVRAGEDASKGAVLLTSRVSIEMVQKTAALGAGVLVAVSAPTAWALSAAQACGLTLIAVARPDGFEAFSRTDRIDWG